MSTEFDVVSATKRCSARLSEIGMTEWAQKLAESINGAATGGELVMAVRWHLQELERSKAVLPDDVRALAREIVAQINKTGW